MNSIRITLLLCTQLFFLTKLISIQVPHLWEGNLALPTSQQPGPLFCFGQNIVDKGDIQLFAYTDSQQGAHKQFTEIIPSTLYGISDDLSFFFNVPIALTFKDHACKEQGLQDIFGQFEYAFYNHDTLTYQAQATLVGAIAFPTATVNLNSPNAFNGPGIFLGTTVSYTGINWYPFFSSGIIASSKFKGEKPGNRFLYQAGICKNISYSSKKWILSGLFEFYGLYAGRDKIRGKINNNTGGNIICIGPALWFSTQQFIIEIGAVFPVLQQLHGKQSKYHYFVALDIGWKFNL